MKETTGSECWREEWDIQDRMGELDEGRISARKQGGRGGNETEETEEHAVLCPATRCQYWSTAGSSCWRPPVWRSCRRSAAFRGLRPQQAPRGSGVLSDPPERPAGESWLSSISCFCQRVTHSVEHIHTWEQLRWRFKEVLKRRFRKEDRPHARRQNHQFIMSDTIQELFRVEEMIHFVCWSRSPPSASTISNLVISYSWCLKTDVNTLHWGLNEVFLTSCDCVETNLRLFCESFLFSFHTCQNKY